MTLGVFTRIDSLAASLWLDEFGTFWVIDGTFITMLRRTWQFQGQTPLYYSLAWLSVHSFGESEIAIRAPSLLLCFATVGILYVAGRLLNGWRAGLYAAALFWLSALSVRYSVAARPYMLVLCTVAVASAGFIWAVRSGDVRARTVWIIGGAAVAWAHYVHYPLVVGLFVAYAVLPSLRLKYRMRACIVDAAFQLVLIALCTPQIFTLFTRRESLSWIDRPNYVIFLEPLLPLIGGFVVRFTLSRQPDDAGRIEEALAKAFLISVLFHIVTLESASIAGMNLLEGRYFVSILVPAILFVATTLARASTDKVVATLAMFAYLTAAPLVAAKKLTGTFSGLGFENWRDAVSDLSLRIRSERQPVVFFRSGFVEEDALPLGAPPETTRAPLKSPGQKPFATAVIPLTYRWTNPMREKYFQERIVPAVSIASHFFVLGNMHDPDIPNYIGTFATWVESTWPSRFAVARTDYGKVELLEFRTQRLDSERHANGLDP